MSAILMVRAKVDPSVHDAFDAWYRDEHLPDAHSAFGCRNASRGWSQLEPDTHVAIYEFPDADAANAVLASQAIRQLIAEFDRHWQGKVSRTREVVNITQIL